MFSDKTVLTGIKPTGTPHLGNLVGAIEPSIRFSQQCQSAYLFIADLHALNSVKDSEQIKRDTYQIAATYVAWGLDIEKCALFRQSDIPEVYALANLLTNVTAKGLMNRSHAYKAAVDLNVQKGKDPDAGINMGLFNYPVLMAADILLYDTHIVPVGQDQKQHVEFTRDIANSLNSNYGAELLTIPEPVIGTNVNSIVGTDGRKMSKSYDNAIYIFTSAKDLQKAVMRIKTDSKQPEEPKDAEQSTICQLFSSFAEPEIARAFTQRFAAGGMGYGEAKGQLAQLLEQKIKEPRNIYNQHMDNLDKLEQLLAQGAQLARQRARKTLSRVSLAMLGKEIVL